MESNTEIKKRTTRKTSAVVVETIHEARKQKAWRSLAFRLSGSTRNYQNVNLTQIDAHTKEGDTVIVVGKVLSLGHLNKKIKICALSFSAGARDKIKNAKMTASTILDEIKSNPKATGVKIL